MTRLLIAWMAFIIAIAFLGLDFARWKVSGLAFAGLILLAVWLGLIGGFKKSFWIEEAPAAAERSRLDQLEEQR